MNIRDLKYIKAVDEFKSFAKAANACFVSQPTLSAQIKKLESELDVKIFERDNKHVFTTDAGRKILDQTDTILDNIDQLQQIAKQISSNDKITIRFGAIPTLGPYLFPKIMPSLTKEFKQIEFQLHEAKTEDLLRDLRDAKIDIIMLALPFLSNGLIVKKCFSENFNLALPKNHALSEKATVSINDLQGENILLLNEGHCLREQTLEICNLNQRNNFHATSLETLVYMTELGNGVTLLPEMACKKHRGVIIKPFKNPRPHRDIVMAWRQSALNQDLYRDIFKVASKINYSIACLT